MLKIDESHWGRCILASFACAKKLEETAKNEKELYRQEEVSSISDAELQKYINEFEDC